MAEGPLPTWLFTRAIGLACDAHRWQVDKAGMPYILHPLRVGMAGTTDAEKLAGFLHDVLEDSEYTKGTLFASLFPDEVVQAVDALTKRPGEHYQDYLVRVKANPLARAVKLNDLADNLREDRAAALSDSMVRRYQQARRFLEEDDL
jgi:guanosine-3',5'-bis(diphosphate) 3'-pyrophosphohydrolase